MAMRTKVAVKPKRPAKKTKGKAASNGKHETNGELTATISFNGGPEVPLNSDEAQEAMGELVVDAMGVSAIKATESPPVEPEPSAVITEVTAEEFAMAQAVKIRDAESKCAEAESVMDAAKRALKDAKEFFDGCVSALRRLCRETQEEVNREQQAAAKGERAYPLFDGQQDDSWRSVRLDTLELSLGILTTLQEAKIETMGQLADFSKDGAEITAITGIGPAAAEKIEIATTKFWAQRKEQPQAADTVEVYAHGESQGRMTREDAAEFIVDAAQKEFAEA